MTSIAYSPVTIQASAHSVPSEFGEITLIAHFLIRHGGKCQTTDDRLPSLTPRKIPASCAAYPFVRRPWSLLAGSQAPG
jgi:hypothetical protein